MKSLVCYPMKTLVTAFMPKQCLTITAETEDQFYFHVAQYQPEAVVLFTEAFATPLWTWIPKARELTRTTVPVIIVPLHKDEELSKRIIAELNLPRTYVLPASLTHQELKKSIGQILQLTDDQAWTTSPIPSEGARLPKGMVNTLYSYGSAGVTTFCINYTLLLAKSFPERRIAVVDMNAEKPDLTRFFQLENFQLSQYRPDLHHTAVGQRNWLPVFKKSDQAHNLFYCSAVSRWRSEEISSILAVMRNHFDEIYVDWGYCFPETEALYRMLAEGDRHLFFARADVLSIGAAKQWMNKWNAPHQINAELVISHYDNGQFSPRSLISGDIAIRGILPRISESRAAYALANKSILIEEIFPPKPFLSGLKSIMTSETRGKGAAM